MPKFQYKVKDASGQTVGGILEGADQTAVAKTLKNQGFFVVDVKARRQGIDLGKVNNSLNKVKQDDIVNFTRQLSVMLTTGLTLTEGLSIIHNQTTNPALEKLLGGIIADIEAGLSFSKSIAKHPDVFPQSYIAVISSGENSGLMDKMLDRLADNLEKDREFRGKTKGALVYPLIITVGMGVVAAIMMLFVVPQLTSIYKDLGANLPLPTRIVIAISDAFVNFWYVIIAIIVGGFIGFRAWSTTESGHYVMDQFLLEVPVWGRLQRNINLAEMTRSIGLLAGSGMAIIDALVNVANAARNQLFNDAMKRVAKKIEKGTSLGSAFAQEPIFPPLVAQMARVGEETGKIDEVMLRTSSYYEAESERIVKALTTLLEPIILVVLGVGVGFLILAVILPIFNLTSFF